MKENLQPNPSQKPGPHPMLRALLALALLPATPALPTHAAASPAALSTTYHVTEAMRPFSPFSKTQYEVSGRVVDGNGSPLPGVTIVVKGTTTGTTTRPDGTYNITVPDGPNTLIFSFIGFASQELPVTGGGTYNITLTVSTSTLDEVVVIGYGTTTRRELTGSVATVKSEEIVLAPTHNALEAIQGRAPGVDVVRSSGAAGSGVNINIRGNRSIHGSGTPLIIIDGFQGGDINTLNTNDIESMEVLKDASATAIYGSQGANGVIIVTTKRGADGRAKVSYNGFYGINGFTPYPDPRVGDDYIQLRREAWRNPERNPNPWVSPADDQRIFTDDERAAIEAGQWVNWTEMLMRNGTQQSHNVSIRGGSERTKIFASGGFFQEEGLLRFNDMRRYNGRFNLDQTINKWAKAGILSQVTYFDINQRRDPLSAAMSTSPFGVPYDENGNVNVFPVIGNPNLISPITDERGQTNANDNTNRIVANVNAYVELTPLRGLSIRSNLGTNLSSQRRGEFFDEFSYAQRNERLTRSTISTSMGRFLNFDNIVTYNKDFGDHGFTLTGVTNYIHSINDNVSASGVGQLLNSQLFYNLQGTAATNRAISSGYVQSNMMSYAGRLNYSFRGKYLLTLTNRYDGASRLAPGNKWDSFPSIAGAWIISDEAFLQDVGAVNFLKVRASYGIAGNSGIGPYGTQSLVFPTPRMSFGQVPAPAFLFDARVGNPDLGWEKSATTNLGLDLGFFNNRISANIDLYNTNTSDILFSRALPQSSGVAEVWQNIAATQNRGIELALTTMNVQSSNFTWSSTFTFSKTQEKITQLVDGQDIIHAREPETQSLFLGRPINSFYTYNKLGIWQSEEADAASQLRFGTTPFAPGMIKLQDLNGDGVIDPNNDRMYIGSTVPDWYGGLQNTFRYKGFDLGIFFFARWGQMMNAEFLGRYNPSGEGNGPTILDYWTPENPTNDYPRPVRGAALSTIPGYQTLTFVEGSFFKLKNVTMGYNLPKALSERMHIGNIRLYATGSNLLVVAKSHLVRDYDPERGGAESFPLNRQLVFGVNLDF